MEACPGRRRAAHAPGTRTTQGSTWTWKRSVVAAGAQAAARVRTGWSCWRLSPTGRFGRRRRRRRRCCGPGRGCPRQQSSPRRSRRRQKQRRTRSGARTRRPPQLALRLPALLPPLLGQPPRRPLRPRGRPRASTAALPRTAIREALLPPATSEAHLPPATSEEARLRGTLVRRSTRPRACRSSGSGNTFTEGVRLQRRHPRARRRRWAATAPSCERSRTRSAKLQRRRRRRLQRRRRTRRRRLLRRRRTPTKQKQRRPTLAQLPSAHATAKSLLRPQRARPRTPRPRGRG
mmetsp:Transcript_24567/g.92844  ORF Transcript_24567/g.92844 Transcript_24567/m.92844 type:complete len:291 (-) Transcript_24567:136-1008(-)